MIEYISKEPITKGWSGDKKYCVTTADSTKYLLRISPMDQYDKKKSEFEMMQRVSTLGIPMCQPIEFGICDEGVYSLQSWIDGQDAEDVIPTLSDTEQYTYGLEAGRILKKIHSIPAPEMHEDWEKRFKHETEIKIQKYRECSIAFDGDETVIEFLQNNYNLLKNRPMRLQHGDYGIANLMYSMNKIYAIDFTFDYGDPWQDFESIRWMVDKSRFFASGMVNGYFENDVPSEFWQLLKLYLYEGCFHNIVWSINTNVQTQINTTLRQIYDVQNWYYNMKNPVPPWYKIPCMATFSSLHNAPHSLS